MTVFISCVAGGRLGEIKHAGNEWAFRIPSCLPTPFFSLEVRGCLLETQQEAIGVAGIQSKGREGGILSWRGEEEPSHGPVLTEELGSVSCLLPVKSSIVLFPMVLCAAVISHNFPMFRKILSYTTELGREQARGQRQQWLQGVWGTR